jgi:ABC-type oligopeptide transport system ATPase subunit
MYLAWLVEKGLLANAFMDRYPNEVRQCRLQRFLLRRAVSG